MIPINFMDRTTNLIDEWRWKGEPKMKEESWYITDERMSCLNYGVGTEPRIEFGLTYNGPCPGAASNKLHSIIRQMNNSGGIYRNTYNMLREHYLSIDVRERIEKVIFNDPATIIIWKDGKKTVVKAGEGEEYDPEKGFAMAISKYALGNEGNYYETFKKWLPEKVKIEWDGPSPERSLDEALSWFKDISTKATEMTKETFAKYMNPPEEENNELD